MSKFPKRMRRIWEEVEQGKAYLIQEAIDLLKGLSIVKFKESVDAAVNLGVDTRKSDQVVRGAVVLPQGTGRKVRVAVLAQGIQAAAAVEAGAHRVGFEDLISTIKGGEFDFDVLIATPEVMPTVAQLGSVLGPRGLMPNPKLGTVTPDIAVAVRNAMAGQIQYRADKGGIVHVPIGKLDFQPAQLQENLEALLTALKKARPAAAKGVYIRKIYLSSTMGPGLMINPASLGILL